MDYNELIGPKAQPGSIADWTGVSIIQNSAPAIVEEAQDMIYQRLRHWRMLQGPASYTFGQNVLGTLPYQQTLAAPGDMLEPDFMWTPGSLVNGSSYFLVIKQRTRQEILAQQAFDANGNPVLQQPRYYWFSDGTFTFDQPPDLPYPVMLTYFRSPTPLSSTAPTNFLTDWCKRLLRLACMVTAVEYLKEVGQGQFDRSWYAQLFEQELERTQEASDRAHRATSGGWIQGEVQGSSAMPW